MNLTTPSLLAFCVVFSTGAGMVSCRSIPSAASLTDSEAFFQSEVKPIFEMNGLGCHQGASPEGPGHNAYRLVQLISKFRNTGC